MQILKPVDMPFAAMKLIYEAYVMDSISGVLLYR
jgi:hypothetical protein